MRTLFVHLEGGLLRTPGDLERIAFRAGALAALAGLARNDWAVVLVGDPSAELRGFVERLLGSEGVAIAKWLPAAPENRAEEDLVIGGKADAMTVFQGADPDPLDIPDWATLYERFRLPQRRVRHARKTRETGIEIDLNLDGSGRADIATGIGFFDHMLEQLARHGGLDLTLKAKGDLHIDSHHTIEDVAITLGEAFAEALGDKAGLARYGFSLPMDDCLAQVAVDFGGRAYWVWEAEFRREQVGEMPTEMFQHFFRSFADAARMNVNIRASGDNEHHKIEAIFKAFARALRQALRRDPEDPHLPSTKGLL